MFIKLDLEHNILKEKLAIMLPEEWLATEAHLNIHCVYELPQEGKYYQECLYADNIVIQNKTVELDFLKIIKEAELEEIYQAEKIKLFIELTDQDELHQCLILGIYIKKGE